MDGSRCITTSSETAECRHSGVIPSVNDACFDHGAELSLGKDRMCDAESCKLDLTGLAGGGDVVYDPVIQRSVSFELKRAEGVCDAFKSVLDRVSEVVHGVDAPLCACSVVRQVVDPVDNRISHVEVA